jgi:hypothetical protein
MRRLIKAVAYDLHGFYTGIERVFESIADTIDDHMPTGQTWHKDLLVESRFVGCRVTPSFSLPNVSWSRPDSRSSKFSRSLSILENPSSFDPSWIGFTSEL